MLMFEAVCMALGANVMALGAKRMPLGAERMGLGAKWMALGAERMPLGTEEASYTLLFQLFHQSPQLLVFGFEIGDFFLHLYK